MDFPKYSKPLYIPHGGPDKLGAWLLMFLMYNNGKPYCQKVWFENVNSMNRMLDVLKRDYGVNKR